MNKSEAMINAYMESADPDSTLKLQLEEVLRLGKVAGKGDLQSEERGPLNVFLCGYAGAGNTGADVRVYEIIRQIRHLWGENVNLRLSAIDQKLCAFFKGMTDISEMGYLPVFLQEMNEWADMSIACEGSLFKSSFGDTLSLSMLACLAFANSSEKLSIAYGAEAGDMSPDLQEFIKEFCDGVTVYCRNAQSLDCLNRMGVDAFSGADTAWSFDPEKSDWAREQLKLSGWDGHQPIVTVCPVNPYWWPIRADSARYKAFLKDGSHADSHYGSMFFHAESKEISRRFEAYTEAVAEAVDKWRKTSGAHVVIIGMDRVDGKVVDAVSEKLSFQHSLFKSPVSSPEEIVSVLRISSMLVSSRFHAIVCSMPAGVPTIGLAYDERVRNILTTSGQERYVIPVEEGASAKVIYQAMEAAWEERSLIATQLKAFSAQQLLAQGEMGRMLASVVQSRYPNLPIKVRSENPADYLPPLSSDLQELLQTYGGSTQFTNRATS